MILKVCRQKSKDNGKEGSIEVVTEIYSGNSYKESGGIANIDNNQVFITDYDKLDEITGDYIHFKTVYAFLMNDEGKTIEKIV